MKENQSNQKFDLEDRTFRFAQSVIALCKEIEKNHITMPMISQLVRSSTSIGANYTEANNASSKKDFRNKISICKKESQETKYWLRLLKEFAAAGRIEAIWQEGHELSLIFQKIMNSLDKN